MNLAWVIPLGLLIGVIIGSLGGGGAIVTVPVLVYLFGQPAATATTGSLLIVGLSSLAGLIEHHRQGRVRFAEGLTFGVLGAAGAAGGSVLSALVPGPVLLTTFAALLLVVAWTMLRKREDSTGTRRGWPAVALAATGVGLLTGFFGVGGGFAIVPALVLVLGFGMREAVATSLLVIVVNAVVSLATRAIHGLPGLDWGLIVPFALSAAVGSVVGGRIAARLPAARLRVGFAILLLVIAAFLLVENLPRLV